MSTVVDTEHSSDVSLCGFHDVQVVSPTLEEAIRGFRVVRNATQELVFDKPGDYLVPEPAAAAAEAPAQQIAQSDDAVDKAGAAPTTTTAAAAVQETAVPVGSAGGSAAGEPSEGGSAGADAVAVGAGADSSASALRHQTA